MKTSTKILTGAVAGTLGACVVCLFMIRSILVDSQPAEAVSATTAAWSVKEIAMVDFTGVELSGNWRASVMKADREEIRVEGPEDLLSVLSVVRHRDTMALQMAKQRDDKRKLTLFLTMPELRKLNTRGVTDVEIVGFEPDRFSIDTEGVSSIRAGKGRAGRIDLRGRGVTNLDLKDFPAIGVHLDCEGVVNIDLTMAGGALAGRLKGVGSVSYSGETSGESIRKKGPCRIVQVEKDLRG